MTLAPSDEVLRVALRSAVESSSQRTVAEQLGLTHRGLAKLLDGSTPRASTRRKLLEWYVREARSRGGADEATIRAALDILLDGLPEGSKAPAISDLIGVVRKMHSRAGTEPPGWVENLG